MTFEMDVSHLIATLEKCRRVVADEGKKKALRAGGRVIKSAMQARAPIIKPGTAGASSLKPGDLKSGIRVALVMDGAEPEALIGPSGKVGHVARFVEFGHVQVVGTKNNGGDLLSRKRKHQQVFHENDVPAHPFLRPAFEESHEAALEAERASIAQTIQEQVG